MRPCHVPGQSRAKVIVVREKDWFAMVVVPPAVVYLDLEQVRLLTGDAGSPSQGGPQATCQGRALARPTWATRSPPFT